MAGRAQVDDVRAADGLLGGIDGDHWQVMPLRHVASERLAMRAGRTVHANLFDRGHRRGERADLGLGLPARAEQSERARASRSQVARRHARRGANAQRVQHAVVHQRQEGSSLAVEQQECAGVGWIAEDAHAAEQAVAGEQAQANALELARATIDQTPLTDGALMMGDDRRLDGVQRAAHVSGVVAQWAQITGREQQRLGHGA